MTLNRLAAQVVKKLSKEAQVDCFLQGPAYRTLFTVILPGSVYSVNKIQIHDIIQMLTLLKLA